MLGALFGMIACFLILYYGKVLKKLYRYCKSNGSSEALTTTEVVAFYILSAIYSFYIGFVGCMIINDINGHHISDVESDVGTMSIFWGALLTLIYILPWAVYHIGAYHDKKEETKATTPREESVSKNTGTIATLKTKVSDVLSEMKMPDKFPKLSIGNRTNKDSGEKLRLLKSMLDEGLITQEDYDRKKEDILRNM